ncbi:alpha/beta fold hydrolase [Oryzobacter telluris]|uniref:alpha/beta fold hydrolase n=1 Tax=Oryzobacter telluris TaxID=3149179 RepID=UPI00370D8AB2
MTSTPGLAHDRSGPRGATSVLLLHAGVADRRLWDPQWDDLTAVRDTVRADLRGFGESVTPPDGPLDHVADVVALLDALGIARAHLVGASFGAGVAVTLALQHPDRVASLLLAPPGGSLLTELTGDLQDFLVAERAALAADDLDAATEANLVAWVVGPERERSAVDPAVVEAVRRMQHAVFVLGETWPDDVDEVEPDPPITDHLDEITCPTTVLVGHFDLETSRAAADLVEGLVPGARRVDWPDVAHLPSMERPADFTALLLDHLPD